MYVLASWLAVVWLQVWRAEGAARPYVVTDIIHTTGSSSPLYRLPTWESSLSIFGVQADGDVGLTLIHHVRDLSLNISLEIEAYERESQVSVSGVDDPVAVVTKDNVGLSLDQYSWFSLYRGKNLVMLYQAASTEPFLLYFNNRTVNETVNETVTDTNFADFDSFQVSSLRNASWDFIGGKYEDENEGTVPHGFEDELRGLVEGVETRLAILEKALKKSVANKVQRSSVKELASELYWIKSYVMLLNYFGYQLEGRNMTQLVVDINTMIYQADDVLRPVNKVATSSTSEKAKTEKQRERS